MLSLNTSKRWQHIGIGSAVGILVALAALYRPFVAGNGGIWLRPENDFNAYLVAWNYFVIDTWRYPVFSLPAMGYPEGGSVLFNDGLPITALLTKVVYGLTGARLNPFGWWIFLTYVLQGGMAARIVHAVGIRSIVASTAAAVFAVCATAFMWRMGHTALSSHFLILWAIALYFESVRGAKLRTTEFWLLALIGLLVNSYLFAMVMALQAVTVVALWRRDQFTSRDFRVCAVGFIVVVATAIVSGYGVFLTNPSSMKSTGFGFYSWNLADLLVPPGLGVLRDATGGQYEGEAYIGAGALAVLLAAVVTRPRALLEQLRRHTFFCTGLFLLTAYAASNQVYAGHIPLLKYYLPSVAIEMGNYFRATGRFIWPLAYTLATLPVAWIFRSWRPSLASVAVLLAILLHLKFAAPAIVYFKAATAYTAPDLLNEPRLEEWLRTHQRFWQYPSWACGGLGGSKRVWGNAESNRELQVELLVAKSGIPTNSVYTSRMLKDCAQEALWGLNPQLDGGVFYMIGTEAIAASPALAKLAESANCLSTGWAVVCSRRFSNLVGLHPTAAARYPAVREPKV